MSRPWPSYSAQATRNLIRCFEHGDLGGVNGHPMVREFERAFVERLVPNHHAAFFNSGTSALCAGLFALKLPTGSEVIVPRHTFRSTVSPLLQFGLVPRFADCASDGCIGTAAVQAAVNHRTSAILLTHQWGQPAQIDSLSTIADKHGLALIEDCSHAHGTRFRAKPVGTFGTFSFFSCGTTKMVSGGTGGVLVTKVPHLFDRALTFGQPKRRCESIGCEQTRQLGAVGAGVNLRGNPFSAVLALDHLQALESHIAHKNHNLRLADEILLAMCEELRPVPRRPSWTDGTWYKRPYSVERSQANAWVTAAGRCNIALSHQDPPLDAFLLPAGREYGVTWVTQDENLGDGTSLVVLNTLDMYSKYWDAENFRDRVGQLRSVLA